MAIGGSVRRLRSPDLAGALNIVIRDAAPGDAEAGCETMRRSIAELCEADHRNDPKILASWLANKQPRVFLGWLAEPGNSVLVAVIEDAIAAVGAVRDSGEITLNYVSPDHRFKGVSRTLLAALEKRAVERGNERCILSSTATARRFYLANGYVEAGAAEGHFGTQTGFPMAKLLK
jgi:GNAT superfamily N-acetyltransferase